MLYIYLCEASSYRTRIDSEVAIFKCAADREIANNIQNVVLFSDIEKMVCILGPISMALHFLQEDSVSISQGYDA